MTDYTEYDEVKKLLEEAQSAEKDSREQARQERLFVSAINGMWEDHVYQSNDNKPRYTFDLTTPVINQITGQINDASFDIKIRPAGGEASKEIAEIKDGLIRNIETISNASRIYADAGKNVVKGGIDHWMVVNDYVDDDSFDQDLIIKPIHNSESRVWFDVGSKERDRSDSNYGFLLSSIPVSEFKELYPEQSPSSVSEGLDGDYFDYDKIDDVIIGHVYYKKLKERELVLTNLGRVFELNDDTRSVLDELAKSGETVEKTRKRKSSVFYMRKFDGNGWLEDEEETVFSSIPLVPVYSNFEVIDNKTLYHGVVRKLMDPQRVLNYSLSREIEEGALAPREKYWMTEKQASGHEQTLQTMNTNTDPVQLYNPDQDAPGAPIKQGGAQINPGLSNISAGMQQIIGASSGIFAAGMGDNPGLQSGVAIEKLQAKGDNVSSEYFSALEVAICRTAKIIDEALPKVYDAQRQVRIINQDGSFDMQLINQQVIDRQTGGVVTLNDLSVGKYDVTCSSGPSFNSRQSETVSAILEIASVDPTLLQIGSDILLNNISAPGVGAIAERQRQSLLSAGVIPQSQMTEEELQAMQQQASTQQQQPDANLVLAQAEATKAQADLQKNQIDAQRISLELQQKEQELEIKRQEIALKAQEQNLKLQEKISAANLKQNSQEFEQFMKLNQNQQSKLNDDVNNLNKNADTLNKLKEATGADAIVSPKVAQAYSNQAGEIIDDQQDIN